MPGAQERFKIARELIEAGEYDGARAILRTMPDNPTAQQWLKNLENIAPAKEQNSVSSSSSLYTLTVLIALVLTAAGMWLLVSLFREDDDELPQIAVMPTMALSPTPMLSLTPLPTETSSVTPTVTPSLTATLTATASQTPPPTSTRLTTDTPPPSETPQASATPLPPSPTRILPTPTIDWRILPTTTYYVTSQMANVRACASTNCQPVSQVPFRAALATIEVVSGESLQGNSLWMHLNLGESDGYIHSSVVSLELPPLPTVTPLPSPTPNYGSANYPAPAGSWLKFDSGQVRPVRHIRPADSTVANFNMFNSNPSIGAEYVLVWFEVYCEQQTCDPGADLDIRLIDSTGQLWGEMLFEVLEPDLDMMSGLRGSTLAGWQLFEVPIGRSISRIQVKWPKWFSDPLYVNWG